MKHYKEAKITFTAEFTEVIKDVSEDELKFILENGAGETELYFEEECEFDKARVKDYKVIPLEKEKGET